MKIKISEENLKNYYKLLSDVRVIGLFAFLAVVLMVAYSSLKVLQTNFELQKKENELAKMTQIRKLENENLKLKNVYLNSDEYLELTARRQFNKAKPGEKLYLVPKSVAEKEIKKISKKQSSTREETAEQPKYQKNLEDWRDFLLHRNSI